MIFESNVDWKQWFILLEWKLRNLIVWQVWSMSAHSSSIWAAVVEISKRGFSESRRGSLSRHSCRTGSDCDADLYLLSQPHKTWHVPRSWSERPGIQDPRILWKRRRRRVRSLWTCTKWFRKFIFSYPCNVCFILRHILLVEKSVRLGWLEPFF